MSLLLTSEPPYSYKEDKMEPPAGLLQDYLFDY